MRPRERTDFHPIARLPIPLELAERRATRCFWRGAITGGLVVFLLGFGAFVQYASATEYSRLAASTILNVFAFLIAAHIARRALRKH